MSLNFFPRSKLRMSAVATEISSEREEAFLRATSSIAGARSTPIMVRAVFGERDEQPPGATPQLEHRFAVARHLPAVERDELAGSVGP